MSDFFTALYTLPYQSHKQNFFASLKLKSSGFIMKLNWSLKYITLSFFFNVSLKPKANYNASLIAQCRVLKHNESQFLSSF